MKTLIRHRLIQIFGILGILVSIYLLLQSFIFSKDPLCSMENSIFSCGATEDILKIPGFKYFNAGVGLISFIIFTWCGFRLPKLDFESFKFRRLLLYLINISLGYAIFLRALELFISSKICPWCLLLFICVVGVAIPIWKEWSAVSEGKVRAFIPKEFYLNMVKLTVVFVICSFGTLCMIQGHLPRPDVDTVKNANKAGFASNYPEFIEKAAQDNFPYLVYIYKEDCNYCYQMSSSFSNPEILSMIEKIPRVKLESYSFPAKKLSEKMGFNSVPVLALFNPENEPIFMIYGFTGFEKFKAELTYNLSKHSAGLESYNTQLDIESTPGS